MRIRRMSALAAAAAAAIAGIVTPIGGNAGALEHEPGPDVEVVASGLNNPRGVTVRGRDVYVAESGVGGDSDDCFPDPEGGDDKCLGLTGSVTRVRNGAQERVLDGLASFAGASGGSASGPSDVSFEDGRLWVTMSLGADPTVLDGFGPDAQWAGSIVKANRFNRNLREVADIAAFEASENPAGGPLDTNPTSMAFLGGEMYVTDAGGNSLLRVERNGSISTIAVFPQTLVDAPPFLGLPPGAQIPMDAVPTTVTKGPRAVLYVSQLTGFPFPQGGAAVWKVVPGEPPVVFAEGFTNVIDLAYDHNGNLLVLEIAKNSLLGPPGGALWKVDRDGLKTLVLEEGLFFPSGVDASRNGDIYVSNCGICPGEGELLKITPDAHTD